MSAQVYVSVGSNVNRRKNIELALEQLADLCLAEQAVKQAGPSCEALDA